MKKIGYIFSAFILVASVGFAFSQGAGLWPNFPIIGGAAYCSSTNNNNCVNTVPAGPTSLTGNETVPVDTNASSLPGTAKVKLTTLGAGPYQYSAPATGAGLSINANTRHLILEPAGTIATLAVSFPTSTQLVNNQTLGICSTQIVTALTVNAGAGTTVMNAPTALTVPVTTGAASCPEWVYRSSNTTWYRVH